MKIIILNGNPDASNEQFDQYLHNLSEALADKHTITMFTLREMDIKYCTGCWSCWLKTPGECAVTDDSRDTCRACINSDLALFASPVIMGFTSAMKKKATDKYIPLLHPYVTIVQGECHHVARYDKYPLLGLLLEKDQDTDEDDVKIITDIYQRIALNFKTTLALSKLTLDPVEEVADEINRI